jgi:twitching motility protein PilT
MTMAVNESDEMRLGDLPFSDLYLRIDALAESRFKSEDPSRPGNHPVPPQYEAVIDVVRGMIGKSQRDEGTITYDDMRLRYCKTGCAGDDDETAEWAALRRIPIQIPLIEDLNVHPEVEKALRGWNRRRGLVLIGGATGAGKTTTAVASIHSYLDRSPDVAVTIEDPPEYYMRGAVGKGFCLQFEVKDEKDWGEKVKKALRFRPQYILVGEIRTPEAAAQALRASTSGHLVFATIHGGSVIETVGAVLRLAEVNLGHAARLLLADNLVGVIHQKTGRNGPFLQMMQTATGDKTQDPIRRAIESGAIGSLTSSIKGYEAPIPAGQGR